MLRVYFSVIYMPTQGSAVHKKGIEAGGVLEAEVSAGQCHC